MSNNLFVIVGLGNPGPKYSKTWHNLGFMTIEYLSQKYNIPVRTLKHKSLIGKGTIGGQRVLLVCPQTFMNESGRAVREIRDYYDIDPANILVIYDDLDLPIGKLRLRKTGGSGTHNGMRSIISHLGHGDFPRLRVGMGPKPEHFDLIDYVLANIPSADQKEIFSSLGVAARGIEMWLSRDIETAMQIVNAKPNEETKPSSAPLAN